MKYEEIIKDFNKVLKGLIEEGYMFCPHGYSNGITHEYLIKGNELKRIRLEKDYNSNEREYILSVDTRELDKMDIERVIEGDSPFHNSDKLYEVKEIKRYYELSKKWYVDSKEELLEIKEKCHSRFERRRNNEWNEWTGCRRVVFPDKAKRIVLSFMRKQDKCKSIKLSDISGVEKRIYKSGNVKYIVLAKNRAYYLH